MSRYSYMPYIDFTLCTNDIIIKSVVYIMPPIGYFFCKKTFSSVTYLSVNIVEFDGAIAACMVTPSIYKALSFFGLAISFFISFTKILKKTKRLIAKPYKPFCFH